MDNLFSSRLLQEEAEEGDGGLEAGLQLHNVLLIDEDVLFLCCLISTFYPEVYTSVLDMQQGEVLQAVTGEVTNIYQDGLACGGLGLHVNSLNW